jgi:hypothetical protein
VIRKVLGPKRERRQEAAKMRRFFNLYSYFFYEIFVREIKSMRMRWAGNVARMGEMRIVYRTLVGKPRGKRPLGRPGRRWEDNKMDLKKRGLPVWAGFICFKHGPVAGFCERSNGPPGYVKAF